MTERRKTSWQEPGASLPDLCLQLRVCLQQNQETMIALNTPFHSVLNTPFQWLSGRSTAPLEDCFPLSISINPTKDWLDPLAALECDQMSLPANGSRRGQMKSCHNSYQNDSKIHHLPLFYKSEIWTERATRKTTPITGDN